LEAGANPSHFPPFFKIELSVVTVAEPLCLAFTELIAGAGAWAGAAGFLRQLASCGN
jgi:hypothetical protein